MEGRIEELPLLSIVIATRNRIVYAISAIQSILEIPDPRLELVVQDNSESRDLESYVRENIKDNRFRYRYTPAPFSSIENFNAALELATGEYICLIGDDDGVNPEIIGVAAWALSNDVDCVVGSLSANYRWHGAGAPDTLFTKMIGGVLTISDFRCGIEFPDTEKEMLKLARNGGTYYLDYKLPKLYHGIVRKRCLNEIFSRTGAYLKGLSPDMYSSLSIACITKKTVLIDYPLTIPGVCSESSSIIEGQIKQYSKKLEDAPHFRNRGLYEWSTEVPRIYTVETIWADSGIAALKEMGRLDILAKLYLPKLYAYIINANKGVSRIIFSHMILEAKRAHKNFFVALSQLILSFFTGPGKRFLIKRAFGRLLIILKIRNLTCIHNLKNMVDTSHALTMHLGNKNLSFNAIIGNIKNKNR